MISFDNFLDWWCASAVSFPPSDVIFAQLVFPLNEIIFLLELGVTKQYLYQHLKLYNQSQCELFYSLSKRREIWPCSQGNVQSSSICLYLVATLMVSTLQPYTQTSAKAEIFTMDKHNSGLNYKHITIMNDTSRVVRE